MDMRQLTTRYFVSPQIVPEDLQAIADAGFTSVICNRPDTEIPPAVQAEAIRAAAEAAGVAFHVLPLTHQTMTPQNTDRQRAILDASDGPVLAYCASGTRSSVIWALGQAGSLSADDILAATARAGYALDAMRPMLEAAARQGGSSA